MSSQIREAVRELFRQVGEDPARSGLCETPNRFMSMFQEMTEGYRTDPKELLKTFDEEEVNADQMVIVSHVPFVSLCEHHLLPFSGVAHIGYIPGRKTGDNGRAESRVKIVGLSKLARLLDCFARRLQVQERLTKQITDTLEEVLKPLGSGCIVQAEHQCMSCRGVRKAGTITTTSSLTGEFHEASVRAEFIQLISLGAK